MVDNKDANTKVQSNSKREKPKLPVRNQQVQFIKLQVQKEKPKLLVLNQHKRIRKVETSNLNTDLDPALGPDRDAERNFSPDPDRARSHPVVNLAFRPASENSGGPLSPPSSQPRSTPFPFPLKIFFIPKRA
ncbi:hypothetical protein EVAR_99837_1 [Eumeta japonica]|uniref:Uncharacterized protein n=1 Tax=Eumeta variegata TaxID=151549 RepID=A0A4C1ZJW9_EUMVA|nr:hypothetical protein EVAR_99837_1 [Eumeta japonica]